MDKLHTSARMLGSLTLKASVFLSPFLFGLMLVAIPVSALAGTGGTAEFGTVYTTVEGWFQGTLGKIIAVAALGVGLGMGAVKQSVMAIVIGIAVGLGIYYGPTIVDSIVVATI